jgi:hypothetical protein
MGSWLERDIVRGFPMQGWMVVMLAIVYDLDRLSMVGAPIGSATCGRRKQ